MCGVLLGLAIDIVNNEAECLSILLFPYFLIFILAYLTKLKKG